MAEFNNSSLKLLPFNNGYFRFLNGHLTDDASGQGNNLVIIGSPIFSNFKYGNGVDLGINSDSGFSLPNIAAFKPTAAFTIAMWVKTPNITDGPAYFASWSQDPNFAGIWFGLAGPGVNPLQLFIGFNTGTTGGTDWKVAQSSTNINDNSPHFIVGTWDGANIKVYVDGALEATTACSSPPVYSSENAVRLGCAANNGSTNLVFANGLLADPVFVNGYAWDAAQVAGVYNANTQKLVLTANSDTMIASDLATTNFNGVGYFDVGQYAAGSQLRRSPISFDLSSLQSSVVIKSSVLAVYDKASGLATNDRLMNAFRLLRSWVESQATWNKSDSGTNWGTAGAANTSTDRESSNIGGLTLIHNAAAGYVYVTLTESKVQEWPHGDLTNNGILLQMSTESSDMHEFQDRGQANPPQLLIDYIPSTTTKTITGKAKIVFQRLKTLMGKGSIKATTTQTIKGKASISRWSKIPKPHIQSG